MFTSDEILAYENQEVDLGVVKAIGIFVLCNLDPGSLGHAMLYGHDIDYLDRLCHPVSRHTIPATMGIVRSLTRGLFQGIDPKDTRRLSESRCLVKLADLHRSWWLCINSPNISNALVEPFSPEDFKGLLDV